MRSFQWRLALGFALAVVTAVALTGLLASIGTTQRFEVLISEAGQERSQALAPILAAEYVYWGDWQTVAEQRFRHAEATEDPPINLFIMPSNTDSLSVDVADNAVQSFALSQQNQTGEVYVGQWSVLQNAVQSDWFTAMIEDFLAEDAPSIANQSGQSVVEIFSKNGQDVSKIAEALINTEIANVNIALDQGEIEAIVAQDYIDNLPVQVWSFMNNARVQQAEGEALQLVSPPQLSIEGSTWLLEGLLFSEEHLIVADADGRVVIDSNDELTGQQLDAAALEAGTPIYDLFEGEKQLGTVLVGAELGLYDAQQHAFLDGVKTTVGLSAALGGGAALVLGLLIARQIARPVRDLTEAAERITAGDLDQRVPVRSKDILGRMSQAFNRMSAEIMTQNMLRRRLVNDIAHELNTPLSLIQLEVQAMTDGLQSPEEAADHLQREVSEIHALVADLAYLSDADSVPTLDLSPVDINALVQEMTGRFTAQADGAGITLATELCDTPLILPLDQTRMGRALTNLLSNALRHTPGGGHVRVAARCEPDAVTITVQDDGEGIPQEDLPHIWERFYRSDASRSRDTGGLGLGLAIVRQAVEMHGGRVWAESTPGEGSTFGLVLPVEGK